MVDIDWSLELNDDEYQRNERPASSQPAPELPDAEPTTKVEGTLLKPGASEDFDCLADQALASLREQLRGSAGEPVRFQHAPTIMVGGVELVCREGRISQNTVVLSGLEIVSVDHYGIASNDATDWLALFRRVTT